MKKPRGLRRKCENMVRLLTQQTVIFPQPHRGGAYWHLHLLVARDFIRLNSHALWCAASLACKP